MDAPALSNSFSSEARRPHARLSLTFTKDSRGQTFLSRQYAGYPFHICKTLYEDDALPGMGTIYVQSCAGGLYEHDRHSMEVSAHAGSRAHVTTQASTIVHTMERGSAHQDTVIRAEAGSYLEVLPDPQILFPQSFYSSTARIIVGDSASVVFSESFLTHDPDGEGKAPRSYLSEIIVERQGGKRLTVDRMRLAEETFTAAAPGVLGGFRACGTLLVIAPERMPLAGPAFDVTAASSLIGMSLLPHGAGQLFRVLAIDGAQLKRSMYQCWSWSRTALTGTAPQARRK